MKRYNFVIWVILSIFFFSCSKRKFNSNEWKNANPVFEKTRYNMVDDLIESKILDGKTKEQVKEILGKTYQEEYTTITYPVYEEYGNDIDPVYVTVLIIDFKPEHCYQVQHKVVLDKR